MVLPVPPCDDDFLHFPLSLQKCLGREGIEQEVYTRRSTGCGDVMEAESVRSADLIPEEVPSTLMTGKSLEWVRMEFPPGSENGASRVSLSNCHGGTYSVLNAGPERRCKK